MIRKIATITSVVFVVVSICGCGDSRPDDLPELHPCRISVKIGGLPLDGASVSLIGEDGRWPGNGRTGSDGVARITTRGRFEGIAQGEYKVTISKVLPPPPSDKDERNEKEPESLIDGKYSSYATTPLTCSVKPGPNKFEFTVEKN